jgi:2-polyprenyl-3-methyl-5-hydroxy-6-metoxy-1,4-benzoquinol methylase
MQGEKSYKNEKLLDKNPKMLKSEKFRYLYILQYIKGKKILDVGCGNGFLLKLLENKDYDLTGLDLSPERVEISKKNIKKAKIRQESVYDTKEKDRSFDTVFCLEVIEHLDDYKKAFKEIMRVTKGRSMVSVPNNEKIASDICIHCGKRTPRNRHQNSFTEEKIVSLINKKDFDFKIIRFSNFFNKILSDSSFLIKIQILIDKFLCLLFPKKAKYLLVIINRKNAR